MSEETDGIPNDGEFVPIVETVGGIPLGPDEKRVLQAMFSGCEKVQVELEFKRGFSASRVFRVRPVAPGRQPLLRVAVKIGPAISTRREYRAYRDLVENKLPEIARLERPPTFLSDSPLAGLCYTLRGADPFQVLSLHDYYNQAGPQEVHQVLERRLFPTLGRYFWTIRQTDPIFQMWADYDQILPVNLEIESLDTCPEEAIRRLEPGQAPPARFEVGDLVDLRDFIVTEVQGQEVTLNWAEAYGSYRVRLVEVSDLERYRVGEKLTSLLGRVEATRHSLLAAQARKALGETLDLEAEHLFLPDGSKQPNPLLTYWDILSTSLQVEKSTIHGDLNLENILVEPEGGLVSLIDFALTRKGHYLHDLLRLETEVVTKLIPAALHQAGRPATDICRFYKHLHLYTFHPRKTSPAALSPSSLEKPMALLKTIRDTARDNLGVRDHEEYYQGLTLYLLGALKFKNLEEIPGVPATLPKQVAFWAAASAQGLQGTSEEEIPSIDWPTLVVLMLGITTIVALIIAVVRYCVLPPREEIAFKSVHGRYVTAMGADDWTLRQISELRPCGRFIQHQLANGKIALETCYGRYVTAPSTGDTTSDWMLRQESELSDCGQFDLYDLGSDRVAFRSCVGNFFTAGDGGWPPPLTWSVVAETDILQEWERFTVLQRPPPTLVIADFDSCDEVTNHGGRMGSFQGSPDDSLVASYVKEAWRGCIAKLEYDIVTWSAFWIQLQGADLSLYSQLVFDVKAESQKVPKQAKIELKRARGKEVSILYIPGITTDWQTMRVNLSSFGPTDYADPLSSFTDMEELLFTFDANLSGMTGVIYLDNISLQ